MYLTEEKLLQWSLQGSTDLSSNAYHFIKDNIFRTDFVKTHSDDIEVYLQGSYVNSKNIKNDSDVDIIVQYNGVFMYDDSALSDVKKRERNNFYSKATLTFNDYKDLIYTQLKVVLAGHSRVKQIQYKAKSIKISLQNPSIEVDVVPCFIYKKYKSFSLFSPDSPIHYVEGIAFRNTNNNDLIVNFPKEHIKNGEEKNSKENTNHQFKRTVRFIKKIKSLLVDKGYINEKRVGSYFIENLIYNIPNYCFENSCLKTLNNIIRYLKLVANLETFICQHRQWGLFGETSTTWNTDDARCFIELLAGVERGTISL